MKKTEYSCKIRSIWNILKQDMFHKTQINI